MTTQATEKQEQTIVLAAREDGTPILTLAVHDRGARLLLHDAAGKPMLHLYASATGISGVEVVNEEMQTVALMASRQDGGSIELCRPEESDNGIGVGLLLTAGGTDDDPGEGGSVEWRRNADGEMLHRFAVGPRGMMTVEGRMP